MTLAAAAGAMWAEAYGGVAHHGRLGKALKPLTRQHDDEAILRAWGAYLRVAEAQYASVERFVSTFGSWKPKKRRVLP